MVWRLYGCWIFSLWRGFDWQRNVSQVFFSGWRGDDLWSGIGSKSWGIFAWGWFGFVLDWRWLCGCTAAAAFAVTGWLFVLHGIEFEVLVCWGSDGPGMFLFLDSSFVFNGIR